MKGILVGNGLIHPLVQMEATVSQLQSLGFLNNAQASHLLTHHLAQLSRLAHDDPAAATRLRTRIINEVILEEYLRVPRDRNLYDVRTVGRAGLSDVYAGTLTAALNEPAMQRLFNADFNADFYADFYVDFHADLHADLHTDSQTDLHKELHSDSHTEFHTESHSDSYTESHSNRNGFRLRSAEVRAALDADGMVSEWSTLLSLTTALDTVLLYQGAWDARDGPLGYQWLFAASGVEFPNTRHAVTLAPGRPVAYVSRAESRPALKHAVLLEHGHMPLGDRTLLHRLFTHAIAQGEDD